ncbi:hypothetical protein AVEN_161668-1, partial [Araneus ventricosus]
QGSIQNLLHIRSVGSCGDLVVRFRLSGRRVLGSKADSNEDPPCMWAYCTLNYTKGAKRPPSGVVRNLDEEAPAQASSWSSDHGSKLRGSTQNSPRVASKLDVNIPKLTQLNRKCVKNRLENAVFTSLK